MNIRDKEWSKADQKRIPGGLLFEKVGDACRTRLGVSVSDVGHLGCSERNVTSFSQQDGLVSFKDLNQIFQEHPGPFPMDTLVFLHIYVFNLVSSSILNPSSSFNLVLIHLIYILDFYLFRGP